MHSIRNSCAVTHFGVPAVVVSEKSGITRSQCSRQRACPGPDTWSISAQTPRVPLPPDRPLLPDGSASNLCCCLSGARSITAPAPSERPFRPLAGAPGANIALRCQDQQGDHRSGDRARIAARDRSLYKPSGHVNIGLYEGHGFWARGFVAIYGRHSQMVQASITPSLTSLYRLSGEPGSAPQPSCRWL